jgi:hypothetical protein
MIEVDKARFCVLVLGGVARDPSWKSEAEYHARFSIADDWSYIRLQIASDPVSYYLYDNRGAATSGTVAGREKSHGVPVETEDFRALGSKLRASGVRSEISGGWGDAFV